MMKSSLPLLCAAWLLCAPAAAQLRAAVPAEPPRPNILVLMGDDWSWPGAGALGEAEVRTPTFDRLAREGVVFENAFVAAPSCTPSRLSIATGQWPWRLGEGANLGGSLPRDIPVYPERLRAAGYRIGFARKGAQPSKNRFRDEDPFGPRFRSFDAFLDGRKAGEPFCFWYGSGEPHRPYIWRTGAAAGLDPGKVRVPACLPDDPVVRADLCDYLEAVQRFDRAAGRMLARLEREGELENTIVVMSGDNGMPFPRCKATLYDGGTRVPLAIRWGARVPGGRRVADLVSLVDLAPTFLEAAGLRPGLQMSGRSLLATLTCGRAGRVDPTRRFVLSGLERHVFPNPSRGLRTPEYLYLLNVAPATWRSGLEHGSPAKIDFTKRVWPSSAPAFCFNVDPSPTKQLLFERRADPAFAPLVELAFGRRAPEELYDLRKDPQQLENLAARPKRAGLRRRLRSLLESKLIASGDPRRAVVGYRRQTLAGWTVLVRGTLLEEEPKATRKALALLGAQLEEINRKVPDHIAGYLRTVPLWFSPPYPGVPPRAEYHPNASWLRSNGRPPAMAQGIEFTNIAIFERECRRMPNFVLHELAHAYHHQVLGFDHAGIAAAYRRALRSGSYDAVRRGDGKTARAYAMRDAKEYFAESSEAFFGRNDFYPFVRAELEAHDPQMFALLEGIWGPLDRAEGQRGVDRSP